MTSSRDLFKQVTRWCKWINAHTLTQLFSTVDQYSQGHRKSQTLLELPITSEDKGTATYLTTSSNKCTCPVTPISLLPMQLHFSWQSRTSSCAQLEEILWEQDKVIPSHPKTKETVLEALAELSASYSSALCTQHWHDIICNYV